MKKIFSLAVLSLIMIDLNAQSLLWKITGNGLKKPSYLYGTIHIQDKRVFAFDDTVINTLKSCDAYAMELNPEKIEAKKLKQFMLMKKHTLKDLLSAEEYAELDEFMKNNLGTGALLYNKTKPFFIQSQVMQLSMPKDEKDALDMYFYKQAKKSGLKVYGIEKLKEQLAAVNKISLKDQAKMLMETIRDTANQSFENLVEAYRNQDLKKLSELLKDTTLPGNFEEAFLIKRNKVMAKRISKLIKKQSVFNAIGAAHLPGEHGVIELLREKGYTLEPVTFKFKETEEE
jgi:uncharacterized protein YbaP (TraB family)